ncbi:tetratricopeptide repeat protein [candidate division KSB1 bacterium]|nr:tetratricopeptide repeat protein [candidate division KSB1 bacterium]
MQKKLFLSQGIIILIALHLPTVVFSEEPEAISLLGKQLYRSALQGDLEQLQSNLKKAQADYEKNPDDPERIIWLGRRTAYLWRYHDAIDIYSKGLEKHPNYPKFYRHRGHRYISVREFDKAIADLDKAARLTENMQDEIEPDGAPNKHNIPRSTLKFNLWYHLGLAHYFKGNFEKALHAYLECMKYSKNDDVLCATSDWLYMTYRRLGKNEEAAGVLEPIQENMEILENTSYHNRLLMYKGLKSPDELLNSENPDELSLATQGYGVGNWYLYTGKNKKAREIFKKLIAGKYWPAFGFIAAEAELQKPGEVSETGIKPTVYLVRHAEKLADWPGGRIGDYQPLSSAGIARTEKLADYFKDLSLSAIYSSNTTRTLHTAFPLAQKKELKITVAEACKDTSAITAFFQELNEKFGPEDAVLLVTHSNLVPYHLMKAGLPKECEDEMGFTHPTDTSWILIEGYDHIWKIEQSSKHRVDCGGVTRIKY